VSTLLIQLNTSMPTCGVPTRTPVTVNSPTTELALHPRMLVTLATNTVFHTNAPLVCTATVTTSNARPSPLSVLTALVTICKTHHPVKSALWA
jgi:hypothetical protein